MDPSRLGLELLLILLMIVANGVFAMSEIAIVSARRARLQSRADEGDAGAKRALDLSEHPNRFLSTVQIGITLVGILAGAYGGATIAGQLATGLREIPALAPYSEGLALGIVVIGITYLSLVIGELVPKRIALSNPEGIAAAMARPMSGISWLAAPLVHLLSGSTEMILRLLQIRDTGGPPVTEAEITAMLEEGTEAGVFQEDEQEMVERVFWLGDQRVISLMTPRRKIVCLDVADDLEKIRAKLVNHRFSRYLVCEGGIDHVRGVADVKDLLARSLDDQPLDILSSLRKPLFVPEGMRAMRLLELFRESGMHLAVVIDEYGGVEGIVTLNDVLEEIAGDLTSPLEPPIVAREDGSLLVDGSVAMEDLWERLGLEERREEERGDFHTVGGFVFTRLGRVPAAGEAFTFRNLRVEVIDMDGNRVDKVLVSTVPEPAEDVE